MHKIINMDNPDYHIDVERFCSPFIDFDNPEEYNSKEVNYRYVKYTQNMNVSFSERYPILTYIIHSGFISGYQNRYGDNLKPPTNVYHRMTA